MKRNAIALGDRDASGALRVRASNPLAKVSEVGNVGSCWHLIGAMPECEGIAKSDQRSPQSLRFSKTSISRKTLLETFYNLYVIKL